MNISLYYREQDQFICDILKPVSSITEIITIIGVCVRDNLNYHMIIFAILIIYFFSMDRVI
jgi:hypothetical protein